MVTSSKNTYTVEIVKNRKNLLLDNTDYLLNVSDKHDNL